LHSKSQEQAGAKLSQALAKLALPDSWDQLTEKESIPTDWVAGKELIIRLTQSSWAGAGTELGNIKILGGVLLRK
jgi:hypothetical protein